MLGFSEHEITQVLDNLDAIFSLSDVYRFVEIWDMCHAQEILKVISKGFNDVTTGMQSSEPSPLEENGYDFDWVFSRGFLMSGMSGMNFSKTMTYLR